MLTRVWHRRELGSRWGGMPRFASVFLRASRLPGYFILFILERGRHTFDSTDELGESRTDGNVELTRFRAKGHPKGDSTHRHQPQEETTGYHQCTNTHPANNTLRVRRERGYTHSLQHP